MKHARTALVILILFVTPLLLSGFITSIPIGEAKAETSPTPTKVSALSYETHGQIDIDNDTDFYDTALAEGWLGDGSPGDPYIIEGYSIASAGTCIAISDVTYSFEIRGCYLTSVMLHDGDGININTATDVVIVNTTIVVKTYTMVLMDIDSLEVRNCTTDYCEYGLYIWESEGAIVEDCVVTGIYFDCLRLYLCNNSVVTSNEFLSSVQGTGVRVLLSHHVTIFDCEITGCADSGIYAADSPHLTVEGSDIHDNWYSFVPLCGVYLHNADYASIVGNEIYHNARNGIFIQGSDFTYIFDNNIYDNSDHGIDAVSSNNGTINQNDIHSNGWWHIVPNAICGIYLGGATIDWVISENSIWNNTPAGITLEGSAKAQLADNDIFNNTDEGIYANNAAQLLILENQIHGNGWNVINDWEGHAISFGSVVDSRIEGNEIFNNTHFGIYAYGDRNEIIGNEVYDHPDYGIAIIMCANDTVAENVVYNNDAIGIEVYSMGSNITDNIVFDNGIGIHLYLAHSCRLWGNDIGWNDNNALEESSIQDNMWYNNVTDVGNWWGDYNGTGVYYVSNGTHSVYPDLYPSKSLDLVKPAPIDFEILETGNVIIWEASALNPSHYEVFVDSVSVLVENWDGNNIEYLADGLSHGLHTIEIEVYHISGHSTGNSTTAAIEDLTPPSIDGPSHINIVLGDRVSEHYTATDPSGIEGWQVNDTVNFAIDSNGVLTGITDLPVGEYTIRIEVSDIFGHIASLDVIITVTTPTDDGFPTTMLLVLGAGGAVVVVIILVVILKKR